MATMNITCPACNSTNRLPESRLNDGPKCGKCKAALFYGQPIDLGPSNFSAVLTHNDIPVLVDCWASWCGPCKSFAPAFAQAAGIFERNIRLAKLNTEEQQQIASGWNIRSIPTLILFKKGKEIDRISGALSLEQLKQWVSQHRLQ